MIERNALPEGRTDRLEVLGRSLLALRKSLEEEEARQRHRIDATLPKHRLSAANLAHYLGLRKRDIRPLQLSSPPSVSPLWGGARGT